MNNPDCFWITLQKEIGMNIYVGNLSYEVTEDDLQLAFEPFGQVESVTIIKDKDSGQSKGFGFVEMASKAEGQSAIDDLNGKEIKGRAINVNEARPRTESRSSGGGYGGGRGGQGGGRGGQGGGRGGQSGGRGGQGGSRGGQGGSGGGQGGGRGGQGGGRGGQGGGGRGGQGGDRGGQGGDQGGRGRGR